MLIPISQHQLTNDAHTTAYLSAGPSDGPALIFVHGWPELSLSWRHQLPVFGALGFHALAPDLRGFGRSTVYPQHADYTQRLIVDDMLQFLAGLGHETAVWIGHDWGSPVVWNIASHHPQQCRAAANLCVPYHTLEYGMDACLPLVDRKVYPEDEFPLGQWEYQGYYEEQFTRATHIMDANPFNVVKALFRKGNPTGVGKPSATAYVRKNHGWFNGADEAPDLPHDPDVVTLDELREYADALETNGFFGPNSYYMNHAANSRYALEAANAGYLDIPTLFLAARYDFTCETINSRLGEPMRKYCRKLTEHSLASGHWMAQERPQEVNAMLASWLAREVPQHWPKPVA